MIKRDDNGSDDDDEHAGDDGGGAVFLAMRETRLWQLRNTAYNALLHESSKLER